MTDPSDLRIAAVEGLAARLVGTAEAEDGALPNRVAVIAFDDAASVVYPMGDPNGATFEGLEADGVPILDRALPLEPTRSCATSPANSPSGQASLSSRTAKTPTHSRRLRSYGAPR